MRSAIFTFDEAQLIQNLDCSDAVFARGHLSHVGNLIRTCVSRTQLIFGGIVYYAP